MPEIHGDHNGVVHIEVNFCAKFLDLLPNMA